MRLLGFIKLDAHASITQSSIVPWVESKLMPTLVISSNWLIVSNSSFIDADRLREKSFLAKKVS